MTPPLAVETKTPCCKDCGKEMWYSVPCWNGCDEGWITDLHEQDPLWYDEDDVERCAICRGKGGWLVCLECHPDAYEDGP